MKVRVTIEENDDAEMTMGISAEAVEQLDIFRLLIAGAEMVAFDHVRRELRENGATEEEAEYAAPLRTRIFAMEALVEQSMQPYQWIQLDS
jgi:hypothetical protein